MADSIRQSSPAAKWSAPPRLREPESWRPFALAMHASTMGIQKIAAAACGVGPSRFSAMCCAQEAPYSVQLCRVIDAAVTEGTPDPFAELRMVAARYGFDLVPQKASGAGDVSACSATLAREAGELLAEAITVAKSQGITPEQLAKLEAEADDVIEICHRLKREAQAAAGNVRAIKSAAKVRGRVKHTRTGACTAKHGQKCQHGHTR